MFLRNTGIQTAVLLRTSEINSSSDDGHTSCNNVGDVSMKKVDVHSHFLPGIYQAALEKLDKTRPDGIASLPKWSPKEALATMDRLGVETAFSE
jgi:hypothetical protein